MLKQWLKRATPKPTWRALVDALRRDAVGEGQLAEELGVKYCNELPSSGMLTS